MKVKLMNKIMDNLLDFGGSIYYIDIDRLEQITTNPFSGGTEIHNIKTSTQLDVNNKVVGVVIEEVSVQNTKEVNTIKHEIISHLMSVLLDEMALEENEDDIILGAQRTLDKKSLATKIAINTLMVYGILKEQ